MTEPRFFATRHDGPALVIEVLQPVGSLADDSVLHELDRILAEIGTSAAQAVIVDFHRIAYFGSSLLEALRVVWRHLQPLDGRIVLCNLSPVGREIIELAKFDHVWPIVDSLADAQQKLA